MTKKLTIGADPELVLVNPLTGRYVSAQSVFTPRYSAFGLDGNTNTAELRPAPSVNPLKMVENIYKILNTAKTDYPQVFRLDLRASDPNIIVGGHLHFGHDRLLTNRREGASMALDGLLSPLVASVEIPDHRRARINSGYGKLGDWRPADWGFEYRTPASWLATRRLAEAVAALGYAVVNEFIRLDCQFQPDVFKLIPYTEFLEVYDHNCMSALRKFLPDIIKEINHIPTEHRREINYLIRSARAGRPLLETEIKSGWAIRFITLATMKLANLPDLIKKLSEALTVPNDNLPLGDWIREGHDYRVRDISANVSTAIQSIVGPDILELLPNPQKFLLKGLKADRGNVIQLNILLADSKHKQLKSLIADLCKQMDYPEPTIRVGYGSEIYLPRAMRERDDYLSEAVVLVVWLYCNRDVYKSKTRTKTGREIFLPFGFHNAILPIVETIKNHKRSPVPTAADFVEDGGEILILKLIEYARNELLPRLLQVTSHGNRLRLPIDIRQTLQLGYRNTHNQGNYVSCTACDGTPDPSTSLCNYHLLDTLYAYSFS